MSDKNQKAYCYYCGCSFPKSVLTHDHVPPRCFSDVYSDEYKKNRITLPCCLKCNKNLSQIDGELRDYISILKDGSDGNKEFLRKGISSIIRHKEFGNDYSWDVDLQTYKISFDYQSLEQLFLKCNHGAFFQRTGQPIKRYFNSKASQKLINRTHSTPIHNYFEELHKIRPESFLVSGHENIYRASILGFNLRADGDFDISTNDFKNVDIVTVYMVFHNIISCMVVNIRKDINLPDLLNHLE